MRVLAVAILATLAGAAPAAAAPLPGVSFRHTPSSLTRGRAVTLRLRLAGGRRGSRRAVLTVAVSKDKRLGRHDQVLATRSLRALRARGSRAVKGA